MEDEIMKVIKPEYWSKADAFLLPLTGLNKNETYETKSYLFWDQFTIDDYKLILVFAYDDEYEKFIQYCRTYIFPVLDKKGYLIESYDTSDRSIFILDMSEWAMDIQQLLSGKYSKFSTEAKDKIINYHRKNGMTVPIWIYAAIYPNKKMALLKDKTPIEYISKVYDFDMTYLQELGEVSSIFDRNEETLLTDINIICHTVT